jgi:hypothetical protein
MLHIRPPAPPKSLTPDTPHSPGRIALVTAMDRYARLWVRSDCKQMFVDGVRGHKRAPIPLPYGDRGGAIPKAPGQEDPQDGCAYAAD